MPASTPQALRKQVKQGKLDPVYLIVGDDDAEMAGLAAELSSVVEDELRAFNLERLYAGEKIASPAAIVQSARTLPMMGDRRMVVVLRAERILKPKRRSKIVEEIAGQDDEEPAADTDALEAYVRDPEPRTTLVLVAADIDRSRRLYKTLAKQATIVECYGLGASQGTRLDLAQAAAMAEAHVKRAVADAGQQIDPGASRLIARRAGTDIATLRGDLDRLLLYAAGKPKIELKDVQEVVSGETAQDDWAVTAAIQRGNTAEALRQLGLALESGGVSFQILGQLGWFVREKLPMADPRRVPAAIEALLRTDLDLKSSIGDPRILLERLVIELCRS
ncbi:MAG: DNA polymerase III subunit delta [Acidobacteriota bacterium]